MGSFAEVLTKPQQTKNINKFSYEIGKKLETFNSSLTTYNKTKSSTGVATISINPNKTKTTGATTIELFMVGNALWVIRTNKIKILQCEAGPFRRFSMCMWQNVHVNIVRRAMMCDVYFPFIKIL